MNIIRATANHIDDLLELNRVVQNLHVEREPRYFRPFDDAVVRSYFHDALQDHAVTILLAVADGKALGYVLLRVQERSGNAFALSRKFLDIEHLAVAPDSRKQGIGAALIDEAFAVAKSLGIAHLELSVWAFNETAQRLFRKRGFESCMQRMRAEC